MSAHIAVALLLALLAPASTTDVPSYPLSQAQSPANTSSGGGAGGSSNSPPCHLDLSAELFGGVAAACGAGGGPGSLDRGRCCPNATPTAAVKELEKSCRNASYAGCSRCVQSLQKLKGNVSREVAGGDRARRMLGRDCQLMGLTWLLAKNKTAYIPTVSAVLRAMLYSARPTESASAGAAPPRCSPDQENMPLAVDSLQFERASTASSAAATAVRRGAVDLVVGMVLGWLVFDVFP
uniref:SPARK domain-containing protein n=1 Tax=Leersia perrieri TaxID=77586 RepID=A0A0D9X0A2_9ORYZ